jgi:CRISPR-associated protein Cas2
MFYVICYDISDDCTRDRMSKRLLDFGTRIQESVFECVLDERHFRRLSERIRDIPLRGSDKVRIYHVCRSCVAQTRIIGPGEVTSDRGFYLV